MDRNREAFDTDWTQFPTCPYCGYENDDYGCFEGDGDRVECECPGCEKMYIATMHLDINFSTQKPPKCSDCGKEYLVGRDSLCKTCYQKERVRKGIK